MSMIEQLTINPQVDPSAVMNARADFVKNLEEGTVGVRDDGTINWHERKIALQGFDFGTKAVIDALIEEIYV